MPTFTNNLFNFIHHIPWFETGFTVLFFIFSRILIHFTKRYLSKKLAHKNSNSFINHFLHQEKTALFRFIPLCIWLLFITAAIYLWSSQLEKAFYALHSFYAPIARAIIILLIAYLGYKALQLLTSLIIDKITLLAEKSTNRGKQRVDTLNHVFRYGYTIIIISISTLMLLDTFGINLQAILATVGIASVAIGFGAQSLVKDIIGGTFILSEDQYGVGDVVIINGEGGLVEKMTLRITQLRNTKGTLITVPNGSIEMVKNLTSEWSRVDYKIGVAYDTDLDNAMTVIMEEATLLHQDMPQYIISAPEKLGVDEFEDSAITLRLWIKTAPLKQWLVKRALNRRVHIRFEKEKIEIPFPQRTLWIKTAEDDVVSAFEHQEMAK